MASYVEETEVEETVRALKAEGFDVYVLSTARDSRHGALFDAVRATCPLDPDLVSDRSWDAFVDSLTGGLLEVDHDRFALVWTGSAAMRDDNPAAYETAELVLEQVIGRLTTDRRRPRTARLYLSP
jgi:hypothetical protein